MAVSFAPLPPGVDPVRFAQANSFGPRAGMIALRDQQMQAYQDRMRRMQQARAGSPQMSPATYAALANQSNQNWKGGFGMVGSQVGGGAPPPPGSSFGADGTSPNFIPSPFGNQPPPGGQPPANFLPGPFGNMPGGGPGSIPPATNPFASRSGPTPPGGFHSLMPQRGSMQFPTSMPSPYFGTNDLNAGTMAISNQQGGLSPALLQNLFGTLPAFGARTRPTSTTPGANPAGTGPGTPEPPVGTPEWNDWIAQGGVPASGWNPGQPIDFTGAGA